MIYILAKYPKLEVGHYWSFDEYLRESLYELKLDFVFLNPDAKRAEIEDHSSKFHGSSRFIEIQNSDAFIADCVKFINQDSSHSPLSKLIVLLPWVPQFSESELDLLSELEEKRNVIFIGLTAVNASTIIGKDVNPYRYIHQDFFESRTQKLLWVSDVDNDVIKNSSFIAAFPDYARKTILPNKKIEFDLAFFGLLTPYRGLFEILIIALFNPSLKIWIKGYGYAPHRIFRPWKFKIFRYSNWKKNIFFALFFSAISLAISLLRFLPNVTFSSKPFSTESELDSAIEKSKTIFYCPKLPHGSGLTNKALANDKPVLWNGIEGRAYNLLRVEYPQGEFMYSKIFMPGAISRMLKKLPIPRNIGEKMKAKFISEIARISEFYENTL